VDLKKGNYAQMLNHPTPQNPLDGAAAWYGATTSQLVSEPNTIIRKYGGTEPLHSQFIVVWSGSMKNIVALK
jgi:hypothetical protein